jgi:hypothetical protein
MRRIIATFAVLLGVAAFAGTASAQTTTPTTTAPTSATTVPASTLPGPNGVGVKLDGPLTFSTPTVAPGGTVKVNGTGLAAGSARLALVSSANPAGVVIGDVTVGADGVLSGDATIPADTVAGAYYIRAIDASVKIFGGAITVAADTTATTGGTTVPGATTAPGDLPFNGPLATLPVILGAVLIGFAGFAIAQRSRTAS